MSKRMTERRVMEWIFCATIVLVFALISTPAVVLAQDYPTKPINLTVCISTGGTVDLSTRILASG